MGIFRQFPYSNFHDMNMDTVLRIMREMQDEWAATKTEWASYKEFIDNYFANLDVSEEVLAALRVFAADGTLNRIMDPVIATETAEWLTEHITPTTPPVDNTLTIAGAAADAKTAGDRINEAEAYTKFIQDHVDRINEMVLNPTINIFDYLYSIDGHTLKNDGSEYVVSTGYTSEFIPVDSNTQYHKRYVFNSARIADVVFYNANKEYLGYFGNSADGTFTTPATCKYIKITGLISNKAGEIVQLGDAFTQHAYYSPVASPFIGGAQEIYMYANNPIIFDNTNMELFVLNAVDGTNINVKIPGYEQPYVFSSPVSVGGSGKYLYFNRKTKIFSLSNHEIKNKDIYSLGAVNTVFTKEGLYRAHSDTPFVVGYNQPVLKLDLPNHKITVQVPASTYLWYNSTFIAIPEETYTLTELPNHITLWMDVRTKKISNAGYSVNRNKTNFIPIADINNSVIQSVIPYIIEGVDPELFTKKVTTYGDSLTWYDGRAFTWGEHQGETCIGFQSYLKKYMGAVVTNKGQSGKTTPQICSAQIETDSANIAQTDYAIIMPSVNNDDRLNVNAGTVQPIGSTFDTTTTAGALQHAIEYIYSIKENVRIVLMVEPQGFTYVNGAPKLTSELIAIAVRNVAELYGIPCIDLRKESGINELTRNAYYADPAFEDGNQQYMYHPNNDGWKVLARIICDNMRKY